MSRIITLANAPPASTNGTARLPHILLVVDQFPRAIGGGETIALRLASLLPQYGFRASILIFAAHPNSAGLNSPPCPVYMLPIDRTYDFRAMRAAFELRRFIEQEQVEIVQTFFESSDIWAGFITKVSSDAKLIWSRRDMGILRTTKHHLSYRLMAGMPDAVFAVSEQVRQHCIEVDGIDPDRVQTIYNGLDLSSWDLVPAREAGGRATVVTTVGNIRRVKGHDVFVRAAGIVVESYPDVQFTIGGDVLEPEYFAELQRLVSELKLDRNVTFVGPVKDLHSHLQGADIFALPSRSEGFSNAIIEAMAAGLPVVATDVGGNAEAVESGRSGYVVPPEDAPALASAILKLLGNRAAAERMGVAGKELVRARFTTEAMMERVTATYLDLRAR